MMLRAFAWMSRGVRSPARDMLLTDVAPRDSLGRAFGLERAGDNIGAIIGPLLAAFLVGTLGARTTMLFAIVPGAGGDRDHGCGKAGAGQVWHASLRRWPASSSATWPRPC